MGLRWKIALSLALVAMIATFTVGLIGYRTTSARLVDEVDRSITQATGQMIGRAVDGRITDADAESARGVRRARARCEWCVGCVVVPRRRADRSTAR